MTAAIFALIGVLIAQISLHLIEWTKSRREQQRARRERELSLKRETYLPLVNALSEQMSLFLSIPGTHHTKLAEWKLSPDSQRALGTIGLIGSEQVIDALNQASKQLTRGSMRLIASKMEEVKLVIELEGIESRIKQINDANTQNVNRMKNVARRRQTQSGNSSLHQLRVRTKRGAVARVGCGPRDKI